MRFFKIVGCFLLGLCPVSRSVAQEQPKSLPFLIDSLKRYTVKFDVVEASFTYQGVNAQQVVSPSDKVHWQRQGNRERLDVVETDAAGKAKTYDNFSVGEQTAIYEPELKMAILRSDKEYMPLAFKPDEMLLLKYQGKRLYEYLQEPKASVHVVADEEVNYLPCEVVQFDLVLSGKPAGYDVKLYFAKTLDYAPVKLTVDDQQGDRSAITLQYSSTTPNTPEKCVYEVASDIRKLNPTECRVDKLTFGVNPTDFAIKLPTGTYVNDLINKKHYLIK